MLVCDGLKGLPDAVSAVWEKTIANMYRRPSAWKLIQTRFAKGRAQTAKTSKPV